MKDIELGILGMHIVRDRTKKLLWLSQEKYMTKVIQRFNMADPKPVGSTLLTSCNLSKNHSLKSKSKKDKMIKVSYVSNQKLDVRNAMYPAEHQIPSRTGQPVRE